MTTEGEQAFIYLTYAIIAFATFSLYWANRKDINKAIQKIFQRKNSVIAATDITSANGSGYAIRQNAAVQYVLGLKAPNSGAAKEEEILKGGEKLSQSDAYKSIYEAGLADGRSGQDNS